MFCEKICVFLLSDQETSSFFYLRVKDRYDFFFQKSDSKICMHNHAISCVRTGYNATGTMGFDCNHLF